MSKLTCAMTLEYVLDVPDEELETLREQAEENEVALDELLYAYVCDHDSRISHAVEWADHAFVADAYTDKEWVV